MGCVVHGVAKSQTQLNDFHFHFSLSKEARYSKLRNLAFFTLGTMLPSGLTEMTLFICISAIWARILSFSHPEFLSVLILLKCCTQYASIWKTQQWSQDWKRSVFTPIPKKGNVKECSNYHTIALISHTSKVILKTLQARLQQYMNQEIPDVQAGFRKGICWIIGKAEEFQKTSTSASLTMLKPLTVWVTTKYGNS